MSAMVNIFPENAELDKLGIEITRWDTYVSVRISLGNSYCTLFPKFPSEVSLDEQVGSVVAALMNPKLEMPKTAKADAQ